MGQHDKISGAVAQKIGSITQLMPQELLTRHRIDAAARQAEGMAGNILPDLCPAIEDMLQRLGNIGGTPGMSSDVLRQQAKAIALTAMRAGLPVLMRAAHHVADCADRHDSTARAATRARLLRLGAQAARRDWLVGDGRS